MTEAGFTPPAYPYDRLDEAQRVAAAAPGGIVDLSVGTPTDPPPIGVLAALADPDKGGAARGYPASIGSLDLREAIRRWEGQRLGLATSLEEIAVCVGTKEFVATVPQWLKLRHPGRDRVLYPALSYPTYEMGARLAGVQPVPVAVDGRGRIRLEAIADADAERALMLWVNTPGNPAGGLDDLAEVAAWGRDHDVPVFSDECYVDYTWDGPARTILGTDEAGRRGLVAVHSLSKRSNLAGIRVGWYSGDAEIVGYLREVRKHAGLMVAGPVQRAAVAALSDEDHVDAQRRVYHERLVRAREILAAIDVDAPMPQGGFYLWAPAPDGDEWAWTRWLAEQAGTLVSPGTFYGDAGRGRVRLAMVAGLDRLDLMAKRLGV